MKLNLLNIVILFALVFTGVNSSRAQALYAITQRSSNNFDYLSTVDPITGSVTIISPGGIARYVTSGISAMDSVNKRFFFMSLGDTLFTVSLTSGNLLAKNKISLAGSYFNVLLEYNCNDSKLYAITQKTVNNMDYLSSVDPMTGVVTLISTNPMAKYVSTGLSSLDPVNKRFFFMSSGDSLYTVDLNTGNLLAKNKISIAGAYHIQLMEFNRNDSKLYAISQTTNNNQDYLSSVDPMTGVVSLISTSGLAKYVSGGVSALDPVNKRFFFMSLGDTLYTASLVTGNLVAKNKISVSGTYFNVLLEYTKSCAAPNTVGIGNRKITKSTFTLFPNPFSQEASLITDENLENAALYIYNYAGQELMIIQGIYGQSVKLNRGNLPAGLYFMKLTQDNKVIASDKFILAD